MKKNIYVGHKLKKIKRVSHASFSCAAALRHKELSTTVLNAMSAY